jgi:hypothetical protein
MNGSDNQEIQERPLVEKLVPTNITEVTQEDDSSSTLNDESLALLSPDDLGEGVLTVVDSANLPGTTVTVPIAISDAEGLQSLTVNLTYDTSILDIVDPNEETTENEGVKRAGISADWELDPNNPVANVNEETGEVSISLVNTGELPQADEDGNVPSGTILEIDFQVSEEAELGTSANIDLQTARVGVNDQDLAVGDANLQDGNVTVGESSSTIELFRFRNTNFDTGTYVYVGAEERASIESNPDFNQTFELDGRQEDGTVNPAFTASLAPGEGLIPFYRIRSLDVAGTYLFVSTEEYNGIFAEGSDQRDKWVQEGLDAADEDVPEFYLYEGSGDNGVEFNRFQNTQNNTFLYAGPDESAAIANDPNLSSLFNNQGVAFDSLG